MTEQKRRLIKSTTILETIRSTIREQDRKHRRPLWVLAFALVIGFAALGAFTEHRMASHIATLDEREAVRLETLAAIEMALANNAQVRDENMAIIEKAMGGITGAVGECRFNTRTNLSTVQLTRSYVQQIASDVATLRAAARTLYEHDEMDRVARKLLEANAGWR